MPQETKSDSAPPPGADSLQGLVASREDETALLDALEKAFDYRGDVTLALAGAEPVTGYIFDRRRGDTLDASTVRLLAPGSDDPVVVRFSEIERLEFTGKDTAHGKTFEKWIERYVAKKMAGEAANIDSEPLDD